MGEPARKRVTIDEFLVWGGEGDRRHGLAAGEIVAMAPPSSYHGAIAGRLIAALGQRLKPPRRAISSIGFDIAVEALYDGLDFAEVESA